MHLTLQELTDHVMALGRCLMVDNPRIVNQQLASCEALEEIDDGLTKNRWIRLINHDLIVHSGICVHNTRTSYIFSGEDRSGHYFRDLPPDVDPTELITIDIPEDSQPIFVILTEMEILLQGLSVNQKIHIYGTNEIIELEETQDTKETLTNLLNLLARIRRGSTIDYNQKVVSDVSRQIREDFFTGRDHKAKALKKNIKDAAQEIDVLRQNLGADGWLTSWFMIFRDVCIAVEEQCGTTEMARYALFGIVGKMTNPLVLICELIMKLVREGLQEIASKLAYEYLEMGENFIDHALSSKSIGEFSCGLYNAGLFFVASNSIYMVLDEFTSSLVPEKTHEFYKRASNVSEEKRTRVNSSFVNAVEGLKKDKLRMYQAQVSEAIKKGGDTAGDLIICELIEQKYYYPRYFREKLLSIDEN